MGSSSDPQTGSGSYGAGKNKLSGWLGIGFLSLSIVAIFYGAMVAGADYHLWWSRGSLVIAMLYGLGFLLGNLKLSSYLHLFYVTPLFVGLGLVLGVANASELGEGSIGVWFLEWGPMIDFYSFLILAIYFLAVDCVIYQGRNQTQQSQRRQRDFIMLVDVPLFVACLILVAFGLFHADPSGNHDVFFAGANAFQLMVMNFLFAMILIGDKWSSTTNLDSE